MKNILKIALLATAPLAAIAALPTIAAAQTASTVGVAIADLDEAVGKSNAGVLASNQISITYKAQIDAVQARAQALNTELQNLRAAIGTAQRAANPNQAAIQAQVAAFQKREGEAQREIEIASLPFQTANAYAREQIAAKLEAAARAAMTKKKIGLLLKPEAAILNSTGYDVTTDIIAELNALVTTVSTTPPAGWRPGQGAGAGAAAPRPASPGTTPPKPAAPTGR